MNYFIKLSDKLMLLSFKLTVTEFLTEVFNGYFVCIFEISIVYAVTCLLTKCSLPKEQIEDDLM